MGDVVNLRRVRKAKGRAADAQQAAENRVAFGRTKAERALTSRENERTAQTLDAHRLASPDLQP